ncbi:hypothetical protein IC582_008519 [Cucumis melo]
MRERKKSKSIKDFQDEIAASRTVPAAYHQLLRTQPAKSMATIRQRRVLMFHHTNATAKFSTVTIIFIFFVFIIFIILEEVFFKSHSVTRSLKTHFPVRLM